MFYDDAITMPILKHEQQRIQDDLDQITARLDTFDKGCADAQIRIRAYLALATNSYDFYRSLDPANRRLCNQVFFTKIILTEDNQITHEYQGTYDTILDP
ncbi:MAG: recombinase family protein, partial [Actinomycetia bacterium]|nr:recombinase family protein [Actinomycetes bacterium]